MDIISINKQITENVLLLRKTRDMLRLRAEDKANANGEYEKAVAITMINLKNGKVALLDGKEISYPSATGLEKIAKGVCYKESIAKDIAESNYKNAVYALQSTQAIINALQSMLRYTDEN